MTTKRQKRRINRRVPKPDLRKDLRPDAYLAPSLNSRDELMAFSFNEIPAEERQLGAHRAWAAIRHPPNTTMMSDKVFTTIYTVRGFTASERWGVLVDLSGEVHCDWLVNDALRLVIPTNAAEEHYPAIAAWITWRHAIGAGWTLGMVSRDPS